MLNCCHFMRENVGFDAESLHTLGMNGMIYMNQMNKHTFHAKGEAIMTKKSSIMPEGKSIATVKVGERGQIVIPKAIREMFGIEPGETLLMLADINQGIAIVRNDVFMDFASQIAQAQAAPEEDKE